MGKSKVFEMLILGLWLLVMATLVFRHFASNGEMDPPLPPSDPGLGEAVVGKRLKVKRIVVVDGSNYDITLKEGDRRLLLTLPVATAQGAKQQVVSFLNTVTSPEVLLESKKPDGRWSGRIIAKKSDVDVDLCKWLADNKFVYD